MRRLYSQSFAIAGAMAALILATPAVATTLKTYITGETGPGLGTQAIFEAIFDPTVAGSASVAVHIPTPGVPQDGIDFVPGSGATEVVTGSPGGSIARYDLTTKTAMAPFVAATAAVPGSSGVTSPSTVLSTSSHVYYVENQFGFDGTPGVGGATVHRIMRVPVAGGPVELVFTGLGNAPGPGGGSLENFEGLEIVDERLYFFSRDPGAPTKRALMSIVLSGGIWDGAPLLPPHISGLASAAGPGTSADGADELDFDPFSGIIFGTNIVNGEVISWDPFGMSGGILISGADVVGGLASGLGALGRDVDGIRSDGLGHLIFSGRGGVLGAIDIAGAIAGADDSDVIVLWDSLGIGSATGAGSGYIFDDLTPMSTVPAPLTAALMLLGLVALGGRRRA